MKSEKEIKEMIAKLKKDKDKAVENTRYIYAQECENKIIALRWAIDDFAFIALDYDPIRKSKDKRGLEVKEFPPDPK